MHLIFRSSVLNIKIYIYLIYILSHNMLGTAEQKFFTVKDIPAADFIRAYADFLKKNNKLERPQWVDYVKTGKSKLSLM